MASVKRLLVSGFALLLAACLPQQEHPLRVATNVWPGYESLYLARSLGVYEKSPIRLVEMTSSSEVSYALRNGTVEAGALTLDEALNLMQDGVDLRVVLVMDVSNGADVLLARGDIATLQDLRGKRVGAETGAVGAVMLDAALEAGGLEGRDVHLVPLTENEHASAWREHRVDALVTFEPIRTELLEEGAHDLFNSSQIPERIVDVLVVRSEALHQHREGLRKLLSGHFTALQYMVEHAEDAAARMMPRLAISPEEVATQFKLLKLPSVQENLAWLAPPSPKIQSTGSALNTLMLQRHLLKHPVDVRHLAEPAYLPGRE